MKWKVLWLLYLLQYEMKGTVSEWLLHLLQNEMKGTVIVVPAAVWSEKYSDCCTCCSMKLKVQWLLHLLQNEMKGTVIVVPAAVWSERYGKYIYSR